MRKPAHLCSIIGPVIFLILFTESKFVLQSQYDTITTQALLEDPFVQVQGTSKHFSIEDYQLTHLKFMENGKNKRKTYDYFVKRYKKIVNILISHQIIPNQNSMIHSGIQMNFNNKRRVWEFSRVFVIYSDKNQMSRMQKQLEPYKLITVKERIAMGYLNQKLLAIKAFNSAKTKLEKFLKKKLNSKLQIIYIKDIEIKGKSFLNQQDIESQIKRQNNFSNQRYEIVVAKFENRNKDRSRQNENDTDFPDQDAVLKVLFKVGEKYQQQREEELEEENLSAASANQDQDIEISPEGELEEQL